MADNSDAEKRLDKLEEKLKVTFDTIEKKFDQVQHQPAPKNFQGVQPHKMAEMEERFGRLEEKLKMTFNEIEKRFEQVQQQPHINIEDRVEELEDLLLLLHLESTKMREKVGDGLDFGITPATPAISERLTRIESELASHTTVPVENSAGGDIYSKIALLEDKVNSSSPQADESTKEAIRALEKKVNTLEALLEHHGRKEIEKIEKEEDLLSDIQNILKGR